MKLETIFKAAINDMRRGKAEPHCGEPATDYDYPLADIGFAEDYAEPDYTKPRKGILFANWNHYPTRLANILEKLGYDVEWNDEWVNCDDCNRAIRTEPDSYSWRRSYIIYNGEIVCRDCALSDLDTYEDYLINNYRKADTFDVDWTLRGFKKLNVESYEAGLHHHQDDRPEDIIKKLPVNHDYLFSIPSVGQFDIYFDCWIRKKASLNR